VISVGNIAFRYFEFEFLPVDGKRVEAAKGF